VGRVRKAKDHLIDKWSDIFQIDDKSPSGISWKISGANKVIGKPAGWLTDLGYWKVEHENKAIQVHRIIYYLHRLCLDSTMVVDHINGNPSDNSINNLRLITYAENCRNKKLSKNNKTGTNGVYEVHDFIATWMENDKQNSKKFSVFEYGVKAKEMAESFRSSRISELNEAGYNYSSTHGLKRE
jgi:hypothetical protein